MKEVVCLPDNLRINAPVTPNESVSRPSHTAAEPPQILPTNPNRVPGNGNQTKNPGSQTGELLQSRNSVFGQFIGQLSATPDLSKSLQGLVLNAVARQESIAARQPEDSPLRMLLSSIEMEPDQAAKSLSFQQENATQFGGPLFRLLGQISEQSANAGFDLRLADFLKAFSGYFSRQSTTLSILANLDRIRDEIPPAYAKDLRKVMSAVTGGKDSDRQTEENLTALKKEIIPFLAKYVSQTNDYGKARGEVSMLLHNTAILNVSTRGNLEDRFDQLFRYCKYNLNLPDATMDLLRSLFGDEIADRRIGKNDAFCSALATLLSAAGDTPGTGADRSVLHDITRSILLDNSVYMPFQHIFLPVSIDGRFLFAQMWVEKKEEEEEESGARGRAVGASQPTAVYLTFEIQDLGYFEAAVQILDRHVELSLSYPPALDRFRGAIRTELTSILEKDGLDARDVKVSPCASAKIPQIIQDKIEERRSSVDVSV